MADWPVIGGGSFADELNPTTASSTPTTVSCPANDTKGSWVQVIASTEHDFIGLHCVFLWPGNGMITFMVDIGVGGSGSEEVVYENFAFNNGGSGACGSVFIPLRIPAGTRISVRGQSNSGSIREIYAAIVGVPGDYLYQSFSKAITYGAVTATTEGTDLPVGAINTKGAYVELTGATMEAIKHLIIDVCWAQFTTSGDRDHLIDIAVGASGSEQVIISNLYVRTTSYEHALPSNFSLPVNIPIGSRIAARAQQTSADAGYNVQLVLHGLS